MTDEPVDIFWHTYAGEKMFYMTLQPGDTYGQSTLPTHPWSVSSNSGTNLTIDRNKVYVPVPTDNNRNIYITEEGSEVPFDALTGPTVTNYWGTIFLNEQWVPDTVPTVFEALVNPRECSVRMYHRRLGT